MEFSYEDIKASTKDFSLDRLIGKGSHGRVYKGILKGGKQVAVKKPLVEGLQFDCDGRSKLDNEIAILTSVRNPNLVNLIGVTRHGPANKLLITEFMPNGSLYDLLHSSPQPLAWARRARMALQVAHAVLSLHNATPPVIHRDIKCANILLDRRWNARLADFSLAVRDSADSYSTTIPAGTLGYLDPCYTMPEKLGPKNDVFSFGVVLLELVSSRRVMDMDSDPASIIAWAVPLIRDGRMAEVCDQRVSLNREMERVMIGRILSVAERCVAMEEDRRPAMAEVVGELKGVVECIRWPGWVCLNRCVQAWRRCKKKRVTTTSTKIVCKDHLINHGDGEGEGELI